MDSFYDIDKRAVQFACYIAEHGATVRDAAKYYGISKSTVHKDVTVRLLHIDKDLYDRVREILNKNKAERHIRGGMATKRKYEEKGSQGTAAK